MRRVHGYRRHLLGQASGSTPEMIFAQTALNTFREIAGAMTGMVPWPYLQENGWEDPDVNTAIALYQTARGLPSTGGLDATTLDTLRTDYALSGRPDAAGNVAVPDWLAWAASMGSPVGENAPALVPPGGSIFY